jgi:hypothetical protein
MADRQRFVEGCAVADVLGKEARPRDRGQCRHDAAVLGHGLLLRFVPHSPTSRLPVADGA